MSRESDRGPASDPNSPTRSAETESTADANSPASRERALAGSRVVIAFHHREGTSVLELRGPMSAVVGRSFPADLVIAEPSLSRMHARFTVTDDVLTVTDLESRNGTFVAGQRVQEARLRGGEDLSLGVVVATVRVLGPADLMSLGIDNYDRMTRRLREEVVRAREFRRPFSLLMVRALPGEGARRVGHFVEGLRAGLRPVDVLGIYDDHTAMVLMPELELSAARAAASRLLAGAGRELQLVGGLAVYPEAAGSDEELLARCRRACLEASASSPLMAAEPARERRAEPSAPFVVRDANMVALHRSVRQVAPRGLPVLVIGETGVGKEVIAAALHEASGRKGPLKIINCATIPHSLTESILFGHEKGAFTGAAQRSTGLFEEADGGTLFLDEIGELSPSAQAALLRVLQEKKLMRVGSTRELDVDVRIVAATHRDLEAMVAAGSFRQDLLYRLNVVTFVVPPLRERPSEIAELAQRFLDSTIAEWNGSARGFSDDAMRLLCAYAWPGNVRQLRNVIERAAALCESPLIEPVDLPGSLRGESDLITARPSAKTLAPETAAPPPVASTGDGDVDFKDRVRDYELGLIKDALARTQGNLTRAAELLRMPIRTLTYKLKAFGIKEP